MNRGISKMTEEDKKLTEELNLSSFEHQLISKSQKEILITNQITRLFIMNLMLMAVIFLSFPLIIYVLDSLRWSESQKSRDDVIKISLLIGASCGISAYKLTQQKTLSEEEYQDYLKLKQLQQEKELQKTDNYDSKKDYNSNDID